MPINLPPPELQASGPLPSVGPEFARCWCKQCKKALLDREPQVRAGVPWDGPDRPDATARRPSASAPQGWKAVCPGCGSDAHLEDLTSYGPWRSSPTWKQVDAEAWIAHAVKTFGPKFHLDLPADGYDWQSLCTTGPWSPERACAAFEIGLARVRATLGL